MSHELLVALRERTHKLHHELDHHPMMALLLQTQVEASAYANTLVWLHPLQAAFEQQLLHNMPQHQPSLFLATRLPALEQDLHQLGVTPQQLPPSVLAELRVSESLSVGTVAGMLYVLNGARLGSAHIARRLQQTSPDLPCQYFAQADGAAHWPPTLKLLENITVSDYSNCKQAAEQVFRGYITTMNYAQRYAT